MKKRMWLCVALCALLVWTSVPSLAEDCFTIDVDTLDMNSLNSDEYVAQYLSASAQGVRVRKYISDSSELAAPVRLTLMQMDSQTLLFDKDYGLQSGTFDSGVIYLPYVADRTIPYLVTLTVGDYVYAMPFMHQQARLVANNACTYGVRLNDLAVAFYGDWMMGTMVDLNALAGQGSMSVDICASNRYIIGQATLSMQGSSLCVSVSFNSQANVTVQNQSVWVVINCADFAAGVQPPSHQPGEWVDVSGAGSALIVLSLRVDYDPAGLLRVLSCHFLYLGHDLIALGMSQYNFHSHTGHQAYHTLRYGQGLAVRRRVSPGHGQLLALQILHSAELMDDVEHIGHTLGGMVDVAL